jgi:NAD(P)H-hydrate epimerase
MIKEFLTENQTTLSAVTRETMIEIDRIAMEVTGLNLFQMMENAGRNLAELTIKALGDNWQEQNIIVLAGTGGNGGGGICAARHLANKGGIVKVCISDSTKLKKIPATQLEILKSTDAKVITMADLEFENPDIIIDALIGYSLSGEPRGNILSLIKWSKKQLCLKVSLDVPSGIDATTGEHSEYYFKPDFTLTLALPKTGLLSELTGELFLGDIGIPKMVYKMLKINIPNHIFQKEFVLPLIEKL